MLIKIIHILHHSPSWLTRNLEEDIFDGWHVRTAKALQQFGIKNCKFECWLPEKNYSHEWKTEKDGITYRIFPSFALNFGREISLSMIEAIKKEKTKPLLLHLHGIFNYLSYAIAQFFFDVPIVAQHHGDCPPLYLISRRKSLMITLPLLELEQFCFTNTLQKIDHFFCLTEICQKALTQLGIKNKVSIQTMGINFNYFTPDKKDEAKRLLNLPLNAKIILYVGKLDRYKGADNLIAIFQKLKNQNDVRLVIVGASNQNEFYNKALESGAIIIPRQPHDKLKLFYQSADVFVLPGSEQYNRWGGIGVSTIESLACNTPVVSATLAHFPNNYNNVGKYATNNQQLIDGINYVLNHPGKFVCCREVAQRYYDWSKITSKTYDIYKQLFLHYYNIEPEKSNAQ